MSLDGAESNLRIVLNKPANGARFTPQEVSCERKLSASLRLLNFEQRFPGYLQGKHGSTRWDQYNGVVELHDQLSNKYQFYYPELEEGVVSRKSSAAK
ncbi:MAG: hypothetical protein EOP05_03565 [Proteobacteria bacterium]|nr:MAG: hypothetical protein EOP05_03565 [Pseudomonadota bacterium]